ncbi:MAG: hypothetical protein EOP06_09320 [Proteobacteria bacterium]|nr:MAG: hypothetical protein EOP06_09320 [Pseudomonadota bacterium]
MTLIHGSPGFQNLIIRALACLTLLMSPLSSMASEVNATQADYLNLKLTALSIDSRGNYDDQSISRIRIAFESLDKILSDQERLASKYQTLIERAEKEMLASQSLSSKFESYRNLEKITDVFMTELATSYSVTPVIFEDYDLRHVGFKDQNGFSTTKSLILQRELNRLASLATNGTEENTALVQNEFLKLIRRHERALTSSFNQLKSSSKIGYFSRTGQVLVPTLLSLIFNFSVKDSLSPDEEVSRHALRFLVLVTLEKLSPTTKELIASGLNIAVKFDGEFLVREGGALVRRSASDVITQRLHDPDYKKMYEAVFESVKSSSRTCSALFTR